MCPSVSQEILKRSLNLVKSCCLLSPALLALQPQGFLVCYMLSETDSCYSSTGPGTYLAYPYIQLLLSLAILCYYFNGWVFFSV